MRRQNQKIENQFSGSVFGPFVRSCMKTGRNIPYCYLDIDSELFVIELDAIGKPTIRPYDYDKDEVIFMENSKKITADRVFEIQSDRSLLEVIFPTLINNEHVA